MDKKCTAPHTITDAEIAAYLDGAASQTAVDHIESCAYCTAKAAQWRATEAVLYGATYLADCPDIETLLAYEASLLPAEEQTRLAPHITTCPNCQTELKHLQVEETSFAPDVFSETWQTLRQLADYIGRQVIEAIQMPAPATPALGVRGGQSRELVYQAAEYELILVMELPTIRQGLWQVEGQVSHKVDEAASLTGRAALLRDEAIILEDVVDEFGFFAFDGVPAGIYTIRVALATTVIQLPEIQIKS